MTRAACEVSVRGISVRGIKMCIRGIEMCNGPFPSRHLASDTLNDLIISIFLAVATVTAAGLLDRLWNAL